MPAAGERARPVVPPPAAPGMTQAGRFHGSTRVAATLAAVLRSSTVHAQDAPEGIGSAVVRADAVAGDIARVESGAGFATSVDTRTRGPQSESLADLLGEAPGLHVRRQGDGFAPQTITLRGAPASQVTVALDGVVLNDAASDGVDLSLIPPSLVERVDIYRGSAPLRLGVSGLGGAVEIITRRPPSRPMGQVTLGVGSFGARRVSALAGAQYGRVSVLAAAGYRGSNGDFSYYDTLGTPLNPGTVSTRQNNAAESADGLFRACGSLSASTTACALVLGAWRWRQVAGPAGFPTVGPYTESGRVLVRVGVTHHRDGATAEVFAATVLRSDHFSNRGTAPLGDIPGDARSTTWSAELGSTVAFQGPAVVTRVNLRGRAERYVPQGTGSLDDASRQGFLAGVETALTAGAVTVTPAAGVEALTDHGPAGAGARTLASPRLGISVRPLPWLDLRATAGHYERAPTLPELFGDRGVIVGNGSLLPEIADGGDAGAVITLHRGSVRFRAEAAGYARRVRDLITLVQTSRSTFEPYNLDRATVEGLELGLRFAWATHLRVAAAYALVDARTPPPSGPDRRVPGIPVHDLYALVEGTLGPVTLGADGSYVSASYIDIANASPIPARLLLGVTASVVVPGAPWLTVTGAVTNLLDARTGTVPLPSPCTATAARACEGTAPLQDFLGYPLPGRSVFVSLTARTEPSPLNR